MGPGARPPSRSHTRTRSATRPVRPATSMGTRDDGTSSNGTVPQGPAWSSILPQKLLKRPSKSLPKNKPAQVPSSSKPSCPPMTKEREASLTLRFDHMSLDTWSEEEQGNQASSQVEASITSSSLPPAPKTPRKGVKRVSFAPSHIKEDTECSQVVPANPRAHQLVHNLESSIWALTPGRGTRSMSPTKASFLTRDSNSRGYTVNDIDEKVVRMDQELAKIKSFMETTERSSASAKEEVELAKRRGEYNIWS